MQNNNEIILKTSLEEGKPQKKIHFFRFKCEAASLGHYLLNFMLKQEAVDIFLMYLKIQRQNGNFKMQKQKQYT